MRNNNKVNIGIAVAAVIVVLGFLWIHAGKQVSAPAMETQNQANEPAQTTTNKSATQSPSSSAKTWTGILQDSNNAKKGQYMISIQGHTIYINTSRDYSSLVGKQVNVGYQGTTDSFVLGDITAASSISEPK